MKALFALLLAVGLVAAIAHAQNESAAPVAWPFLLMGLGFFGFVAARFGDKA